MSLITDLECPAEDRFCLKNQPSRFTPEDEIKFPEHGRRLVSVCNHETVRLTGPVTTEQSVLSDFVGAVPHQDSSLLGEPIEFHRCCSR